MFQRFHAMKEEREGGFTLIELLVVILIIAILAAIAIPVFLNQRKKGWAAQQESAVKNMATAQESFLADPANTGYATSVAELEAEGFTYSSTDVSPAIGTVTAGTYYCVQATSLQDSTIVRHYESDVGRPVDGACP